MIPELTSKEDIVRADKRNDNSEYLHRWCSTELHQFCDALGITEDGLSSIRDYIAEVAESERVI